MTSSNSSAAAKAIVRRNTEEVQGGGNFEVFEELFADDFLDHTHSRTARPTRQARESCIERCAPHSPTFTPKGGDHPSDHDVGGPPPNPESDLAAPIPPAGLARPGGNVTGLSALTSELVAKRLELMREAVAGIRRIAFLFNMGNPIAPSSWEEFKTAAPSLNLEAQLLDVRKSEDLVQAFDVAIAQRADAILVGNDTVMLANRGQVVELAAKHRMPAMYHAREFVDAGGLMTYGVSYPDLYRRAATFVDKIFKGANPADLPVEQPTKFELVINLKTAKALGLEVPPMLLARADEVIE